MTTPTSPKVNKTRRQPGKMPVALTNEADPELEEAFASITIDDEVFPLIEIRATGDIILDVTFERTAMCEKSMDAGDRAVSKMKEEAQSGKQLAPVRVLYRVRLDTLRKRSKYFENLLGPTFMEGNKIKENFESLQSSGMVPSEVNAELLYRLEIEDGEEATRTLGREKVFEDMLRILHDMPHTTSPKNIGLHYVTVLVTMAERFDCIEQISKYINLHFARLKYPVNTSEEILRKKILILSIARHTPRVASYTLESCTKELILQGSSIWLDYDENQAFSTARWWNLPLGIEEELAYRRSKILMALASLQDHFLGMYNSKTRQCSLGYGNSAACDSFQLGEMVKFLTAKKLLSLSSFSAIGPNHPDYQWPEAYTGNLEELITTLHQVPSYQIDTHHKHCGLRNRLLKPLDHIRQCMQNGAGVHATKWQNDREGSSWQVHEPKKKQFVVNGKDVANNKKVFYYEKLTSSPINFSNSGTVGNSQQAARDLFMAEEWDWSSGRDLPIGEERLGRAFGSIQGPGTRRPGGVGGMGGTFTLGR